MIFNKPKPLGIDGMWKAGFRSTDSITKARTEHLLFLGLAGDVTNQAEFLALLSKIPDSRQRDLVAERLLPMLAFPATYQKENQDDEGSNDVRAVREGEEGCLYEEGSGEAN